MTGGSTILTNCFVVACEDLVHNSFDGEQAVDRWALSDRRAKHRSKQWSKRLFKFGALTTFLTQMVMMSIMVCSTPDSPDQMTAMQKIPICLRVKTSQVADFQDHVYEKDSSLIASNNCLSRRFANSMQCFLAVLVSIEGLRRRAIIGKSPQHS